MHATPDLQPFVAFFEQLRREDLPRLGRFYAADTRFKDPFNEVVGVEAVAGIFRHMFDTLDEPRFVVRDVIVQGDRAFLAWDFLFRMRRFDRGGQCIRGASHLRFGPDGLITEHRDYWDAAEELYEKLPLVGGLMRWLKRRAAS
jgi:ketosteroid isomerase-like protein